MIRPPSARFALSSKPSNSEFRRFAWDGLSFDLPADWNLARHTMRGNVSSLAVEDDLAVRMEMEWTYARVSVPASKIRRRFDRIAVELSKTGAVVEEVTNLSAGWVAGLYTMTDGHRILNALYIEPGGGLLCSISLHFEKTSFREPMRVINRLTDSFVIMRGPKRVWDCLGMAFELNSEFELVGTSLDAGSKLLNFEWRRRRLFIWGFSPADVIIARHQPAQWCVRVLNRFKLIRGPIFETSTTPGELSWQRDWRYPFGRFEDMYRASWLYQTRWEILPESNMLMLMVFNYRNQSDLSVPALAWL